MVIGATVPESGAIQPERSHFFKGRVLLRLLPAIHDSFPELPAVLCNNYYLAGACGLLTIIHSPLLQTARDHRTGRYHTWS